MRGVILSGSLVWLQILFICGYRLFVIYSSGNNLFSSFQKNQMNQKMMKKSSGLCHHSLFLRLIQTLFSETRFTFKYFIIAWDCMTLHFLSSQLIACYSTVPYWILMYCNLYCNVLYNMLQRVAACSNMLHVNGFSCMDGTGLKILQCDLHYVATYYGLLHCTILFISLHFLAF